MVEGGGGREAEYLADCMMFDCRCAVGVSGINTLIILDSSNYVIYTAHLGHSIIEF